MIQAIKVTMEGFEPSRPYEHHPLKMASLPFLHMALNKKKAKQMLNFFIVTWLGLEPRTPSLKVMCSTNWATKSVHSNISKSSDLAGARTQDPIIKSDVLYQLSYQVILFPWMRVQIYKDLFILQAYFSLNLSFFTINLLTL